MGSKRKLTFLVQKEVHKNILGGSSQESAKSAESVVLGIQFLPVHMPLIWLASAEGKEWLRNFE